MSGKKPGIKAIHIVIMAVVAGINSVLGIFSNVILPTGFLGPGSSFLYIPCFFLPAFGLWFGMWGILGGYFSGIIGSVTTGMPILPAFAWALVDFWEGGFINQIFKRAFRTSNHMKTKKDIAVFCIAYIIASYMAGFNAQGVNLLIGFQTPAMWIPAALFWGTAVYLYLPLQVLIMRKLTPLVERSGLAIEGWWS